MDDALQFLRDNPSEKPITAARIFNINAKTLNTNLRRAKLKAQAPNPIYGGQNKILSEAQIKAIYKYVEDSYFAGYGASKAMVFTAIGHLRAAEILPKPAPSWRWFQSFIKSSSILFRVVKTKPIAQVRVTTHDISAVQDWFGV
ncbi:hypothetical protein VF21_10458, partial [Pseudogymnoascus sp. 05NY08]